MTICGLVHLPSQTHKNQRDLKQYQTLLIIQRTQEDIRSRAIMENSDSYHHFFLTALWQKTAHSRFKLASVRMHAGHHVHKGEKFLSWNVSILYTENYTADPNIFPGAMPSKSANNWLVYHQQPTQIRHTLIKAAHI